MNYRDLFDKMIAQMNTTTPDFYDMAGGPSALVIYKLPDEKNRANVSTLGLSDDHKLQNTTFHTFNSSILVSRAFFSKAFDSTLYCAWIETYPWLIILWERSLIFGITDKIIQDRFTRFKPLGSSLPTLTDHFHKRSITNNVADSKAEEKVFITECDARDHKKVIEEFLSNSSDYYSAFATIEDDDDVIDTMSTLRDIFDDVCPLGDTMIATRHIRWQNMNKIILNEFKSKWEVAITHVKESEADQFLPDLEWQEAMWLYVIGCPSDVRSKIDLLSAIRTAFSKLKECDEEDIIDKLKWEGFRPSLAQWIYDRCSSEDFENDVLKLATCMPWNSYLFSTNNVLRYTHLHFSDPDFQAVEAHQVILRVLGVEDVQRDDIRPLQLDMIEKSWTPVNFAQAAFEKIKSEVNIDQHSYILGHCCSEQSLVSMSKAGLSPLAPFQSEQSCGHGMYFFELNSDVMQCTLNELNLMAERDLPDAELDPRGLQFRAFVYALTRVFQNPNCDAMMSPCVLVFLIPTSCQQLVPFDAVTSKLPMCNDNSVDPSSWKCTCPPLFSYADDRANINSANPPITASAICNAISMIQEDDIEKINAFALIGGIVDFSRIPLGVYTSIIADNSPKKILDSLKIMKEWNTKKFSSWNNLLREPTGTFRRPRTMYNHLGGFSSFKPDNCKREGLLEHWNQCPLDPIRETVFVQSSALVNLLNNASAIYAVFLDSDNQWTQRLSPCHQTETVGKIFSEAHARAPPVDSKTPDSRHRYWKNISSCGCFPYVQ